MEIWKANEGFFFYLFLYSDEGDQILETMEAKAVNHYTKCGNAPVINSTYIP